MKYQKLNKDKKIRRLVSKKELFIQLYKYNLISEKRNLLKKYFFYKFLNKFHLNYSNSRIVNRCIYSGRSRWSFRKFRLSRIVFKNFCDNGKINGIRRSSF